MDTLLKDPQGDLLQILLYHAVNEKLMTSDLEKITSLRPSREHFCQSASPTAQ